MDQFWRRFVHEIAPELRRRHKWLRERPSLQVGDIVCVLDDNAGIQKKFPLGRILSLTFGRDGFPRRAKIRTQMGECDRGLNRLYVVYPAENVPREGQVEDGEGEEAGEKPKPSPRPRRSRRSRAYNTVYTLHC